MRNNLMRCGLLRLSQLLLLLILAASVFARAEGGRRNVTDSLQTTLSPQEKLKQAEATADRLIESFHETLDFAAVLKETFVTEPELRGRALRFGNEYVQAQSDESLVERRYIAAMNYAHLFYDYMFLFDHRGLPPGIDEALATAKHFRLGRGIDIHSLTNAEMKEAIVEIEKFSAVFKEQFKPGVFKSKAYLSHLEDETNHARRNGVGAPRIEHGNEKFKLGPETPAYIIRRELFDYYFIEEENAFKLFYVDIRPNFKLF